MMHVLFVTRHSLDRFSGGDKIQIINTKQALERQGIRVTLTSNVTHDLSGIDIVHVFNPSLVSSRIAKTARAAGIPLVISTIHWDMRERYRAMFSVNKAFLTLKPPRYLWHYCSAQIRALLYNYVWNPIMDRRLGSFVRQADLLLPNSQAEADILIRQFGIPHDRCAVVVNGFDTTLAERAAAGTFKTKHHLDDFILCAGRIEYRKNQLALIQALMDFPVPLVFVGAPFDPRYVALCKALAARRGHTFFIEHIDQAELFNAYADARVHALVSWYETPGLASLEACATGTNIVVSRGGCTEEYFGQHAEYCNANDPASIRIAVERAWNKLPQIDANRAAAGRFTWDATAEQTLAAYTRAQSAKPELPVKNG